MGCFSQLVQSKFLSRAKEELLSAQRKLKAGEAPLFDSTLLFDKKDRKYVYDTYVWDYNLLAEIEEMEEGSPKDVIYYIQEDYILFIYSRTRKLIDEAILYSYNVNGDIPLCRSKHIVNGCAYFTVLIDCRINFIPSSPN